MKLANNLFTRTGWEFYEKELDPEQIITTGSNFLIGNGYLGYRGTLAEWRAPQYTACIVTDTYDQAENGRWKELCNVPNGLFARWFLDGEPLSILEEKPAHYRRELDLHSGFFSRSQTWHIQGGQVSLLNERFASQDNVHLLVMRCQIKLEARPSPTLSLLTGIDGDVWSLQGDHFRDYQMREEDPHLLTLVAQTGELNTRVCIAEGFTLTRGKILHSETLPDQQTIFRNISLQPDRDGVTELLKITAIYTSNDRPDPLEKARRDVQEGLTSSYEALKKKHDRAWERIWETSDIKIEGCLEDQVLVRFNLYHNIIAAPAHAPLPIGARGLSTQVYQGAAFWDQEIFNLPMLISTQPEIARNILTYRYKTLDGARGKARRLGYEGAYYAWTSGKTGQELFPDFFFKDVLTNRMIRNHFNDWQIHISPDIVYAIWKYYQTTGDWDFMVEMGAEIIFEVARFLASHAFYKKGKQRYEFIRLLGPDEYHENVDNNAFTSYQAHFALDKAVTVYKMMKDLADSELNALTDRMEIDERDVAGWQDMVARLYLPEPDRETKLIEQFDGYFDLEDILPGELKQRLIDPHEYWGWPNGIAVHTRVLKQADVVQLLALHDIFPREVIRANYLYYEPRTEHGSSLSPSVHSIVASKAGLPAEAYTYFKESATIDLYDQSKKVISGGEFLGGIHTAACGAIWDMIVTGFTGYRLGHQTLCFDPHLPENWESLQFSLLYHGNILHIHTTDQTFQIRSEEKNPKTVHLSVFGKDELLQPGQSTLFDRV